MINVLVKEFDELKEFGDIVLDKTKSYTPITPTMIINEVVKNVEKYGFKIKSTEKRANKTGTQQFFNFTIDVGDPEFGFSVKVINSTDKTLSLRVACGANAFICSNGLTLGEYTLKKKHVSDVDFKMSEVIEAPFKKAIENVEAARKQSQKFLIDLSDDEIDDICNELVDLKIIGKRQYKKMLSEFAAPTYDYNIPTNTLQQVFNHATLVIQSTRPALRLNKELELVNFFNNKFETINE
jgi:hypothetical protein